MPSPRTPVATKSARPGQGFARAAVPHLRAASAGCNRASAAANNNPRNNNRCLPQAGD